MVEAEGDIFFDTQVRKERVFLKHHADMPLFGRDQGVTRRNELSGEGNTAGDDPLEPRDCTQDGGFAATGWAEEAKNFSLVNRQCNVFDGRPGRFVGTGNLSQLQDGRLRSRQFSGLRQRSCSLAEWIVGF